MTVSKAQQKAVAKYMKNNYDEIKIRVENMTPHITKIFEQTALYKLMTFGSTSANNIRKRQGLAFD